MSVERITKKQALRAARAKLPIVGDKKLQENLDMMVGGCCSRCTDGRVLAEAYRIGVEEAQTAIAGRINAIGASKPTEAA